MFKRFAFVTCLVFLATGGIAAPADYQLQNDRSRVGFTWFFNNSAVTGTMPVSRAEIALDFDNPAIRP